MSRGKRYTEDQIVKVLQEIEAGASIAGVAHLMYKPSTSASEYVAIAKCPWNVDGRAEWDSGKGQWNRTSNVRDKGTPVDWFFHPTWTLNVNP
jgi:hypothetical protein